MFLKNCSFRKECIADSIEKSSILTRLVFQPGVKNFALLMSFNRTSEANFPFFKFVSFTTFLHFIAYFNQ